MIKDPGLTRTVNRFPGVPLLYISGKTIILEKPSVSSMRMANKINMKTTLLTSHEQETLKQLKGIKERPTTTSTRRKRKGPKEPNPLSVKKKKPKRLDNGGHATGESATGESGRKRKRRKRVKIAQHVKDELWKGQTELG